MEQTNNAYEKNHDRLVELLSHHQDPSRLRGMTLRLDRFVVDAPADPASASSAAPAKTVASRSVTSLLNEMARFWPGCEIVEEGLLAGFAGILNVDGQDVPTRISLGPAAQLRTTVGPAATPAALLGALAAIDRQVHVASLALGRPVELVAQGYNPTVTSPLDLPLVPRTSHALMNAYLGKSGRFARDAMRCTASTVVSLPAASATHKARVARAAALFSPIASFLCDNALTLRGQNPAAAGAMVGARVWREVDPTRCTLPAAMARDTFDLPEYARWAEAADPVFLLRDAAPVPSDKRTARQLMADRDLTDEELATILANVMPPVRVRRTVELHAADALPPRLAVAFCTFASVLLAREKNTDATLELFGPTPGSFEAAYQALEANGWDAVVYGRPVPELVLALIAIAKRDMTADEAAACESLFQLWETQSTPRDLLLSRWRQTRSLF